MCIIQFGRFYRTRNFADNSPVQEWTCVSPDKKRAIGFIMQKLAKSNTQFAYYRAYGGTGYNSEVRFFPDFASRIYFMENEE